MTAGTCLETWNVAFSFSLLSQNKVAICMLRISRWGSMNKPVWVAVMCWDTYPFYTYTSLQISNVSTNVKLNVKTKAAKSKTVARLYSKVGHAEGQLVWNTEKKDEWCDSSHILFADGSSYGSLGLIEMVSDKTWWLWETSKAGPSKEEHLAQLGVEVLGRTWTMDDSSQAQDSLQSFY